MAVYNAPLQPPLPFRFDCPDEWPKWRRRFEQFRVASGLSKEDEERQINTLLYCLGEDADDVLTSTNISEESRKKYTDVLAKFDTDFKVRKNVIFERVRFNCRVQEHEESVEQFITSLYSLSENCQYGELKDEMICDRIVVGIRDSTLSERLQMDETLTLDKAKKMVRQREAVKEQQNVLKQGEETSLDFVKSDNRNTRINPSQRQAIREAKCTRCGRGPHTKQSCPAKEATCRRCSRKGHFAAVCFSRTIAVLSQEELEPAETSYLDAVTNRGNRKETKSWYIQLQMDGKDVCFKIDTGAEVSAISTDVFEAIGGPNLQKATKILCGPDRSPLKVLGCTTVRLTYKHISIKHCVYVIQHLSNNLLGFPAITALNFLTKVDDIHCRENAILSKFQDLFQGLGKMCCEYEIKLKLDAKSYSLFTARKIPIPLREKVENELKQMEASGVISKVDQPTTWCSGMVVVQKKSGGVRICVDLKPLNENVL